MIDLLNIINAKSACIWLMQARNMIVDIYNTKNKYDIIYADPPQEYKDKCHAGKRGVCYKYEVQSNEWIENLPIRNIAKDDCSLFLWVTMPKLNECWALIEKWGFKYRTNAFTWVKRNKKSNSWFWGMGNWTRANAELCLLAIRGKPKRINAGVHSIIDTPIQGHSKKPDIVRDKIVELMGDLPKIELFARQQYDGWDVWGNQVAPGITKRYQQGILI
jgi:N6-adenosine-specific RNA methylase IME4